MRFLNGLTQKSNKGEESKGIEDKKVEEIPKDDSDINLAEIDIIVNGERDDLDFNSVLVTPNHKYAIFIAGQGWVQLMDLKKGQR